MQIHNCLCCLPYLAVVDVFNQQLAVVVKVAVDCFAESLSLPSELQELIPERVDFTHQNLGEGINPLNISWDDALVVDSDGHSTPSTVRRLTWSVTVNVMLNETPQKFLGADAWVLIQLP